MFAITLTSNAAQIVREIGGFTAAMEQNIAKALDKENQFTVGIIQEKRLSGPRPQQLGVVTNRLRGSIRARKAVLVDHVIDSGIGSNVAYAGALEGGFQGTVKVKAHTRKDSRFDVHGGGGSEVNLKTGRLRKAPTKKVALGFVTVRAHTMKMNVKARHYIEGTVEERAPQYSAAISEGIVLAWNGGRAS